ncbi:MAG: MFS transporter [Pseudoclavibacter sp.]
MSALGTAALRVPIPMGFRKIAALLSLALGGFAIGVQEFVTMGLLPNLASGLLPNLYRASPAAADASAAHLVSAYAAGVVIGAPLIIAFTAKWPKRRLLLAVLAWLVIATASSALLPSFLPVMGARFLAGMPHGVYFGVATMLAARIMGPGSQAKGVAMVLGGLTIANVVGVPGVTWLGQNAGWRWAYGTVAMLFALTFICIRLTVPMFPGNRHASINTELGAFRRKQVWLTIAMGALGFGGFFAAYSFINPIATHVAGLTEAAVPAVLVTAGIGMTIGNFAGGYFGDRSLPATLFTGYAGVGVLLLAGNLMLHSVPGLFAWALLLGGFSQLIGPPAQSRLMAVAPGSETIAAACHHAAFNIANSLGAFLGGLVVAAGYGFLAPLNVGVVLTALGVAFGVVSFSLDRHARRRR